MSLSRARFVWLVVALGLCSGGGVQGQVPIVGGGSVTQQFDGIGVASNASLPTGWRVDRRGVVRTVSSWFLATNATSFADGDNVSASALGGVYNFGAGPATTAVDRAVGGLPAGNGVSNVNVFLQLTNSGPTAITSLTVAFSFEKYRNSTNFSGTAVQVYGSASGTSWVSFGTAFRTNFVANSNMFGFSPAPGSNLTVSATRSTNIAPGRLYYLAWNLAVNSGVAISNAAHAVGIDDVVVTATAAALPPTATLGFAPNPVAENNATGSLATVTLSPPPTQSVALAVSTSPSGGVGLSATNLLIGAGTTTATFTVYPVEQASNYADVAVLVTAAGGGYTATGTVVVANTDVPPASVVINKVYDGGTVWPGYGDAVELLVVGTGAPGSTADLSGMILKDFGSGAGSDSGRGVVFESNGVFSAVPAGTLIVLTTDWTALDTNTPFVMKVGLSNSTYFADAGSGVFNVESTDAIVVKSAGSAYAGSGGAIHRFAMGNPGLYFTNGPGPRLSQVDTNFFPTNLSSVVTSFATSPAASLGDFNGPYALTTEGTNALGVPLVLGQPNNSNNAAYINFLRGGVVPPPTPDPVVFTEQPVGGTVEPGTTVTLSAQATGTAPILFQWWKDASPVPGATNTSLILPLAVAANQGTYAISGSNAAGVVFSSNAVVTVLPEASVPTRVVINKYGDRVVSASSQDAVELLVVGTNGPGSFADLRGMVLKQYGPNMDGDTADAYRFTTNALWSAQPAGTLIVLTTNGTLNTSTPWVVRAALSSPALFARLAGADPFQIGATNMVSLKAAAYGGAGTYGTMHTLANGTARAQYDVAPAPKLLANGSTLSFGRMVYASNPTASLADFNGTGAALVATNAQFTFGQPNSTGNATYIAFLRGEPVSFGTVAFNNQPVSVSVRPGMTANFSVSLAGSSPYFYQWRRNGTNLPGAVTAFLSLTNVTPAAEGDYSVAVSNLFSSAVSSNAVLTVLPYPHEDWQVLNFGSTNGPGTGWSDDPDGDGDPNLAEYGAGTLPTSVVSQVGPFVGVFSNRLSVLVRRNTNATDIQYEVERSTNLLSWQMLTNFTALNPPFTSGVVVRVSSPIPLGSVPREFLRVRYRLPGVTNLATTPQGSQRWQAAGGGLSFAGPGLVRPAVESGRILFVGSNALVCTSPGWVPGRFAGTNGSHSVEIVNNGTNSGVFTSIAGNGTNVLFTADNLQGLATNGCGYRIYPDWTVGALLGSAGLRGGDVGDTDEILVLDPLTKLFATYYFMSNYFGVGWREAAAPLVDAGTNSLTFEQGLILRRQPAANLAWTVVGAVKEGQSIVPVETGLNIVASGHAAPGLTLGSSGLHTGNPLTGLASGGDPTLADTVFLYQGGFYVLYYFNSTLGRWVDGSDVDATGVSLPPGEAFLIQRNDGRPPFNWRVPALLINP